MSEQENKNMQNARLAWALMRDIIAFFGGFGIMIYEALGTSVDRPWLLIMAIGMMGLPFALKLDKLIGK